MRSAATASVRCRCAWTCRRLALNEAADSDDQHDSSDDGSSGHITLIGDVPVSEITHVPSPSTFHRSTPSFHRRSIAISSIHVLSPLLAGSGPRSIAVQRQLQGHRGPLRASAGHEIELAPSNFCTSQLGASCIARVWGSWSGSYSRLIQHKRHQWPIKGWREGHTTWLAIGRSILP